MKKILFLTLIFIFTTPKIYSIPYTSDLTGICIVIEEFIEDTSSAADKVEYLEASSIIEFENGLFAQRVKFIDKSNSTLPKVFNFIFLISGDKNKSKILTVGKPEDFINSVIKNSFHIRKLYDSDGSIILD